MSSSSLTALTLGGRGLRPQATAPENLHLSSSQSSGATAQGTALPAAAPTFSFDFFEKTQCISSDVRLIADPAQPGSKTCSCFHFIAPHKPFLVPVSSWSLLVDRAFLPYDGGYATKLTVSMICLNLLLQRCSVMAGCDCTRFGHQSSCLTCTLSINMHHK